MSLRTRLSIAIVAGLLAAAAAVTPAAADGDWDPSGGNGNNQHNPNGGNGNRPSGGNGNNQHDPSGGNGNRPSGGNGNNQHDPSGGNGNHHGRDDQRLYEGVVTAGTLALRSAPNRGSQIIRFAHRGDIVKIFCKVGGQTVQGNPLWYLLTDGTWAWGAARYIDNIGPAPRWC
ncbi:SH3 domain-containing protein [Streptomyces hawaiiensis]|uniref:SH3 domain-containing protein n=1 Tax=Streptomyces hawaiiensis TaxID=67305 RepID=UPI0031DDEA8E